VESTLGAVTNHAALRINLGEDRRCASAASSSARGEATQTTIGFTQSAKSLDKWSAAMQRNSFSLLLILLCSAPALAADAEAQLAEQGYKAIKTYCHRCHGGGEFAVQGFDILNRDILLARREGKLAYVVAGKVEESAIWKKLADGEMPPDGEAQPTPAERDIIKQWIEAGLPFPSADVPRTFKPERQMLEDIVRHLTSVPVADRKFQRYFTFTHLYNNKAVSDEELRQHRAALSKVVNSLSWKTRIVVPKAIDAEETILNLDLRSFGWDKTGVWSDVEKAYPYGLDYSDHPEREMRAIARQLEDLVTDVQFVRGDWFINTATRPPLYHLFLELPDKDSTLAKKLNVDIRADFNQNRLARAGFDTSGISTQNRLVDRHNSIYGAFWQSYDFKSNQGKGNFFQFPLGPSFPGNKFNQHAFEHDGGEIVFSLPNGLQGYLLVDDKGKRINSGPTAIVIDKKKTSGSADVVNGISCMGCHVHGVIRFKDTVRVAVASEVREKVQELYPKPEVMDALLTRDENRFLKALDLATGPFLRHDGNANKPIRDFEEVVNPVALRYQRDLTPIEAALELPFEDLEDLQGMVRGNKRLAELGLGQFKAGERIKRDKWDSMPDGESLFQKAARELELGTPVGKKS
jgi:mono/diheme cytochrome c family protein